MALKSSQLKPVRQRSYLARDFDGLRRNLLDYARLYYPNRMSDFSENSLGGLFLDMAAYVGDNLSFYLDHQFNELDPENAVETANLQKLLRSAGVQITGAAPSTVDCTFLIEVPASTDSTGQKVPQKSALPTIQTGTTVSSQSGISFELISDLDFAEKDENDEYVATVENGTTINGNITTFVMSRVGKCISGTQKSYTFNIGNFIPFRRLTLPDINITEIIRVYDSLGNTYYEVNDLSEDVVYKSDPNFFGDKKQVPNSLQVITAPFRFTKTMDVGSRLITLTFGGGNADSFQDDVIPDATEFAIPLPNSSTFTRLPINPQSLLSTRTLGVAAQNVTLTVVYRYGGGLSHNVSERSISRINNLDTFFPMNPQPSVGQRVTNSVEVINLTPAVGGEDPPTTAELRALIPSIKNSQQRIVTKEDLLARIYTMPSNFGRVYRAAVVSNPDNPFSTSLYVVSRNLDGKLVQSSDTLKLNLARYLNDYRMISDAIDILDAPVINFRINFNAVIDPRYNQNLVLSEIKQGIIEYFDTGKSQINKPINIFEVYQIIFSIDGVLSVPEGSLVFTNLYGTNLENNGNTNSYSEYAYSFKEATLKNKGLIMPPEGGIFELRFPNFDVVGGSI